jgi:hypothetical protein
MSKQVQRFQTFIARSRPHRVAILTNIHDPNWQDSCLGIIQFFTKLWGGSQSVIIPTDGKTIAEEFWAVLSAHDPDIIYRYQTTGEDLKRLDPNKFEALVDAHTRANLAASGMEEKYLRNHMEESLVKALLDEFSISEELSDQLIIRLAPIHLDPIHTQESKRKLVVKYISRHSSPAYPLTSVLDVIPFAESSKVVAEIVRDSDKDNAPPELWLAAMIGSNDESYTSELGEANVVPRLFKTSEHSSSQLISIGIQPGSVLKTPTPLSLSMTALAFYRSTKSRRYQLPTVVILGDTVSDFCMYYALKWLRGRTLWLPKWFFEPAGEYPSRLSSAVNGAVALGEVEHNQQLALASFSVSNEELQQIKERISALNSRTSITTEAMDTTLVRKQLEYPSHCCTDGNIGDITTRMLVDNELPGWFETPRPAKINPLNPQLHRWMIDITFEKHLLPRHPAIGPYVVSGANLLDVRSGSEAVSYSCPGIVVIGIDMDNNMVRPSVRVPDCESIFRIVLNDCGYESQVSDKGVYASQVCDKFGGLEEIGYSLRLENHRTLLKKYLDTSDPPKGSHEDGTFLNDRRRYLNFSAIAKILGSQERTITLVDSFVSKGIFYRGFIFQCERCADVAWFSISEIGQTFTCRRCGTNQPYLKKSWRHPNEPAWFYKLDEIVYLTMLHNGDVPLLTLDYLRRLSSESFLHCPELRIRPTGSKKSFIEIDICCVSNGALCIGEAKSTNSIDSKLGNVQTTAERYRDLALKMGASMVVFSTSEPIWSQPSLQAISDAFASYPHISVRRITGPSLLLQ